MNRKDFDEYRGGALSEPKLKSVRRYPCFADGCPMPGTIFPGETQGTGDKLGTCAWHYGVLPNDIPKVTRVLLDWDCVNAEVNEARSVLTGPNAADVRALQAAFDAAWARLLPRASGWEEQLRPSTIKSRDPVTRLRTVDSGMRESYADWAKRLTEFLGARVVEVLSTHQRRAA